MKQIQTNTDGKINAVKDIINQFFNFCNNTRRSKKTTNKPIGTKIPPRPRREESRSRRPLRRSSTREVTAKMRKTRAENLMIWCLIDVWGEVFKKKGAELSWKLIYFCLSWPETTPPRSAGLFLKSLFLGWKDRLSGQFYDYYRLQPISPGSLQNEKVIELLITLPKKKAGTSRSWISLAQGNANLLCYVPIVETWV